MWLNRWNGRNKNWLWLYERGIVKIFIDIFFYWKNKRLNYADIRLLQSLFGKIYWLSVNDLRNYLHYDFTINDPNFLQLLPLNCPIIMDIIVLSLPDFKIRIFVKLEKIPK